MGVAWRPRTHCFFFQAEDGIRDLIVTGVQTCALPISQGWFSMGRTDLDAEIRELSEPLAQFGDFTIEHAAFAATDNAPFMAEGVPNLILIQDETPYFPVHHTIADTPDKIEPRDYASAVVVFASTAYAIADRPQRFGRRLSSDEIKRMADETKVGEQWRAAGIWK